MNTAAPDFGTSVTFTSTVTNTSTTTTSTGVTATVAAPSGLLSPAVSPPATGSYANGTWTIGSLAPGASATLTITGLAGDVVDGTQTVTATVTATTADPNTANNTASASEASQPAPVSLSIKAAPGNPAVIDVSGTATVTWTASAVNADNPAAPPPNGMYSRYSWSCTTVSFNVDTYTLTMTFTWTDPNYQLSDGLGSAEQDVQFTTTNSGG